MMAMPITAHSAIAYALPDHKTPMPTSSASASAIPTCPRAEAITESARLEIADQRLDFGRRERCALRDNDLRDRRVLAAHLRELGREVVAFGNGALAIGLGALEIVLEGSRARDRRV